MANKDLRHVGCPEDDAILAFKRGELSGEEYEAVALHLLFCNGCTESLNALPWDETQSHEVSAEGEEPEAEVRLTPSLSRAIRLFRERHQRNTGGGQKASEVIKEGGLRAGQIWRTKSEGIVVPTPDQPDYFSVTELSSRPHLVLITSTEGNVPNGSADYHPILVAPIDAEVNYRGDGDLIVKENESPLGYSFIIQLWNGQMMLQENLESCLGEISSDKNEELLRPISLHWDAEPLGGRYSLEALVLKGLYTDSVMRYRAKEYAETSYLRMPAQSFIEMASQAHGGVAGAEYGNDSAQSASENLRGTAEDCLENADEPSLNPSDNLPREIVVDGALENTNAEITREELAIIEDSLRHAAVSVRIEAIKTVQVLGPGCLTPEIRAALEELQGAEEDEVRQAASDVLDEIQRAGAQVVPLPWIYRQPSRSQDQIKMAAQEQAEPGWPVVVEINRGEGLAPVVYLESKARGRTSLTVTPGGAGARVYRIDGMDLVDFVDARDDTLKGGEASRLVLERGGKEEVIALDAFRKAREAGGEQAKTKGEVKMAASAEGEGDEDARQRPRNKRAEGLTLTEMFRATVGDATVVLLADRDENLYLRLDEGK